MDAKKAAIIVAAVIGLGLAALNVNLFLENSDLSDQAFQAKQALRKKERELKRLEDEKKKIGEENKKLKNETLTTTELINKLQAEKDKFAEQSQALQEEKEEKEAELAELRSRMGELEKKKFEEGSSSEASESALLEKKSELESKVAKLESTLAKERALYHYNLGVAYAKAKLFDQAIASYNSSLTFDPDNAEACYNLGLLYDNFRNEPEIAILYYRKYLKLKPDAADKEEVKGWIDKLSSKVLTP